MKFLVAVPMMAFILISSSTIAGHIDSCSVSDRECIEHLVDHANSESKKGAAAIVAVGLVWLLSKGSEADTNEKYTRYNELLNGKGIRINSFDSKYRLAVFPNQIEIAPGNAHLNHKFAKEHMYVPKEKLFVFEYEF